MNKLNANGIFIDTTNNYLLVGFLENEKVVHFTKIAGDRNLTAITHEVIEKLFDQYAIIPKELKNAYVTTGPGSFTGVRIGVTIIKVWNEINPFDNVYTINGLELLKQKDKIPIIDARGNKFFVLENNEIVLKDNKFLEKIATITYSQIKEQNLVDNINIFKKLKSVDELTPTYIKKII